METMIKFPTRTILALLTTLVCVSAAGQADWPNLYASDLSERLLAQGRAALDSDQPIEAERLLEEAIQVIKVNHGLHSTRQIPVLELLISSHLTLNNWSRADAYIDYFEWLNSRNYQQQEDDLEAFLEGSLALSNLLLGASADPDSPRSVRFLVMSKNLDWRAVTAIENELGPNSSALLPWLYRIALNHYYQTTLIKRRFLSNYTYKSDDGEVVSGWSMPRNESIAISDSIGSELLDRLIKIAANSPESDPTTIAMARIYRADWDWLFGRHGQAITAYKQAYSELLAAGVTPSSLDRFFTRPTVLPATDLELSWSGIGNPAAETAIEVRAWSTLYPGVPSPAGPKTARRGRPDEQKIRARFDLLAATPYAGGTPGIRHNSPARVRELTLVQSDSAQPLNAQAVGQQISLLNFRPGLSGGEPVEINDVRLEYTLAEGAKRLARNEDSEGSAVQ